MATRSTRRSRNKQGGKPRRAAAKARVARSRAKRKPSLPAREREAPHVDSPTAVAAEALRTGVPPRQPQKRRDQNENPRGADKMRVGDPDDDALRNEYSGEDTPGGSTPTPDQNSVDEIGTAYGLQDEDSGALRSAAEVLSRRDRKRNELKAPRRPQP